MHTIRSTREVEAVGFDLSGVIIGREEKHKPGFATNENIYLPSALPALASIVCQRGAQQVFVVSCADNDEEEGRIRDWLIQSGFYARTGILPQNVLICRERSEKGVLCVRWHIGFFFDDRLESLGPMKGMVSDPCLFQPRAKEIDKPINAPYRSLVGSSISRVDSWDALAKRLLS